MIYKQLGESGLRVSVLGLGLADLHEYDPSARATLLDAALDAGVNLLDTANVYGDGASEEVIGAYIAQRGVRDTVVLATKFGARAPGVTGVHSTGSSAVLIKRDVEASLRRLRTDHIDLYQFHDDDLAAPLEESLGALDDLVHAGKVRYYGTSNWSAWRVVSGVWTCRTRGFRPPISHQTQLNVLERRGEVELVPAAERHGVGVLAYSPLAGGLLTERFSAGHCRESRFARRFGPVGPEWDGTFRAVRELSQIAADARLTLATVAYAWLRDRVTAMIAAPTDIVRLQEAVRSLDVSLSEETLTKIDALVPHGSSLISAAAKVSASRRVEIARTLHRSDRSLSGTE